MQAMINDNDLLIATVQRYPLIYDSTSPDYHNRDLQVAAWDGVAHEVGRSVQECKKNWRVLRNTFVRSQREDIDDSQSNGSLPKKKRKQWYMADRMSFIKPYLRTNKMISSRTVSLIRNGITAEPNTDFTPITFPSLINGMIVEPDTSATISSLPRTTQSQTQIPLNSKFHVSFPSIETAPTTTSPEPSSSEDFTMQAYEEEEDEDVSTIQHCQQYEVQDVPLEQISDNESLLEYIKSYNKNESNGDIDFLKSLIPDISQLTDKNKRKFKIKVMNLLHESLEEQDAASQFRITVRSPTRLLTKQERYAPRVDTGRNLLRKNPAPKKYTDKFRDKAGSRNADENTVTSTIVHNVKSEGPQ